MEKRKSSLENMEIIKNNFWFNKKVLITGHTGFKGSWLSFYLSCLGCKIIGYSLSPQKQHKLYSILNIKKRVKHNIFGNIQNKLKLFKVIQKYKPEIIFHLAAQPIVIDSYQDPNETINTNVIGTANLLEIIKKNTIIKSVVIVTSDKCYKVEGKKILSFKEDSELGGLDPYSASKACAEILTNSYIRSFFYTSKNKAARVSTARSGNILGGGDWGKYRLMTDIVNAKINNKILKLRNISAVRPWIHVLDTLTGYIELAKKNYISKEFVGAWNFSPMEKPKTVKKILEYCIKNNLLEKNKIIYSKKKYHETKILMLNSSKARSKLKWKPKFNFNETLDYTFDWYEAYRAKKNMELFSYEQIKKFITK